MKAISRILVFVAAIFLIFSGSAMALSFTTYDSTVNWPGYEGLDSRDVIGTPSIESMTIIINDTTSALEEVSLEIYDRRVWDGLFINVSAAGEPYYKWNFYVKGFDGYAALYEVADGYDYFYADVGRVGHPAGFTSGLTFKEYIPALTYDGTTLTFDLVGLKTPIIMDDYFVVGYAPYCANDVILTPEPMTLLLLGLGLIGVAGIRRKF